jgi:hypothetical protein
VVAGVGDELLGGFVVGECFGGGFTLGEQEAGLFQVVVGEEESHAAASGKDADLFEIVLGFGPFLGVAEVCGSREKAAREFVKSPGEPQAAHGFIEMLRGFAAAGF